MRKKRNIRKIFLRAFLLRESSEKFCESISSFEGCPSADQCMCPSVFFILSSCRDRNIGIRVSRNRGNGTITSVSSQIFSIKTLPNVGSELLGIQENQKDAEPRQKEKGRWYKTGVSRITRHSKDTVQCRSRITRHSGGPKGRQFQK